MKNLLISLLLSIFLLSCSQTDTNQKQTIFVSILPQKFFVESIVGDKFNVEVMVPPGYSAENYEPTPNKILTLNKSPLFFTVGMPFENILVEKISSTNKNIIFVNSGKGIPQRELESPEIIFDDTQTGSDNHSHEHVHGEHCNHDHSSGDIHSWLDPILAKKHAENILEQLVALDKENADYYKNNFNKFTAKCDSIDTIIKNRLKDKKITFLIFHPSFGYYADRYNLRQLPIEFEGKEPTPQIINKIIKYCKDNNIKNIFIQEQFNSKAVKFIETELKATTIKIDDLAYDYFNNLLEVTNKLQLEN